MQENRFVELQTFVNAVERGSFSAAARQGGVSASAVSKLVSRLEQRLQTRLFNRSTRSLSLTAEGSALFERARRILTELAEAELCVRHAEAPAGLVRISTSASFATHMLAPLVPAFRTRYPAIDLVLVQSDAVVDLLGDRFDIALRSGALRSSALRARKLGESGMVIVGAPAYLARTGTPADPDALGQHSRIGLCYTRADNDWPLRDPDGRSIRVPIPEGVRTNDGEGLRHLALAGAGLARLPRFTVAADIAAGRLVPVLEGYNPGDTEAVHAVYVGGDGLVPGRVRAVLDFLAETVRLT